LKTVVIAQARMGSSRLPGKVLMPLGGRSVIEHVTKRASRAALVNGVCIATTVETADDVVALAAQSLGIAVFRGSENDVLGRYAGAAAMMDADIIVRITSDCPLVDPGVVDRSIQELTTRKADYVAQEWNEWPQGVGCEVFPRALLDRAVAEAGSDYDREHVTPWIRNSGARVRYWMPGPGGAAAEQRWLLDYPEDYNFLEKLFRRFPEDTPPDSWEMIWQVVRSHPELWALNRHLRENVRPK
jgi:spore coat polysaccharide biosynthesis protein SpsF